LGRETSFSKSQNATSSSPIAAAPAVYVCRGAPVVLDSDVAALFGVDTRRLNEQVKRNRARFGDDFCFRLEAGEYAALMSQIATSNPNAEKTHGGKRKLPLVFTEHGVVMAATLLRSEQAAAASRFIVKVFIEARRNQLALTAGQNMPAAIAGGALLPIASEARLGLVQRLNGALERVLDTMIDASAGTTVRDEARAIVAEGLHSLKEYLRKAGVQNEKTLAEVRKLLADAEAVDADTAQKKIEIRHRELALVAKQLRLILAAQLCLDKGSIDEMLVVLKDLGEA
jgi:hypothetical protein